MKEIMNEIYPGVHYGLALTITVVGVLIIIVSIIALCISLFLAISYIRYNHKENSAGMTGEEIARQVLDQHGLGNINVSATGSVMFGNSYSHYFKKVRLRRFTYKKKSVSSMVMASQKSMLAVLDQEGDPDMKHRIKLIPIITFGPFACIPLILIGVALDYLVFNQTGVSTAVCAVIGVIFYLYAFILSLKVLKTEKKAQARALDMMQSTSLANEAEIRMAKKLFRLYNIEYVNDMVLSLLELIYYVLQIVAMVSGDHSASTNN